MRGCMFKLQTNQFIMATYRQNTYPMSNSNYLVEISL